MADQSLCPSCNAADNNLYTDANGVRMRACGRCMIQWRESASDQHATLCQQPACGFPKHLHNADGRCPLFGGGRTVIGYSGDLFKSATPVQDSAPATPAPDYYVRHNEGGCYRAPATPAPDMTAEQFLADQERVFGQLRSSRLTWQSACQFAEAYAAYKLTRIKELEGK